MAETFDAKAAWASHAEREARGKKVAQIAAQHRLHLTNTVTRYGYDGDSWSETTTNWAAVADLLDKVAPGWDASGVRVGDEARLQDLMDNYWNIAFAEGRDGRDHDTEDGAAQRTRSEINAILKRIAGVQEPPMTKPNLGCAFNCDWPTKCCALGTLPDAPGVPTLDGTQGEKL